MKFKFVISFPYHQDIWRSKRNHFKTKHRNLILSFETFSIYNLNFSLQLIRVNIDLYGSYRYAFIYLVIIGLYFEIFFCSWWSIITEWLKMSEKWCWKGTRLQLGGESLKKMTKIFLQKKYMCMYHLMLYKSWFKTKLKWVSEGKMQWKL